MAENHVPIYPGSEYNHVGKMLGYVLSTLRISLGDFSFVAPQYLEQDENVLYWIVWFALVLVTCIIFLNFIIAEASNSYESVKSNIKAMVNENKASLCAEAELMLLRRWKGDKWFPKYIVVRQIDT